MIAVMNLNALEGLMSSVCKYTQNNEAFKAAKCSSQDINYISLLNKHTD